jgi:hypothetical protein
MREPERAPDVSPESGRTLLVGSRCPVCGRVELPWAADHVLGAVPADPEPPARRGARRRSSAPLGRRSRRSSKRLEDSQ